MQTKLEPKYSEIQRKLYQDHKLRGVGEPANTTNKLIEEVSKMIAEALQLAQENSGE